MKNSSRYAGWSYSSERMRKSGKGIEELTGVRQSHASEIWTAYQQEGESSLEPKKRGSRKGTPMLLTAGERAQIRKTIITRRPEEFGIPGSLWTLKRVCAYVWKRCRTAVCRIICGAGIGVPASGPGGGDEKRAAEYAFHSEQTGGQSLVLAQLQLMFPDRKSA